VSALVARLLVSASFAIVYVHASELFPTCIRSVMMGVANASARIGGTLAPFVIYAGKL